MSIKESLMRERTKVISQIEAYNKALKENDAAKLAGIEQALREAEASYAEVKQTEVFGELQKTDNPVKAAITLHSFNVIGHRADREDGVVKGFELVEDKPKQIDLVKLCKACKLPTDWQYKVEKFNQLLALRTANELKMTKAQIKAICDSFYMNDLARQVDLGGTPDSNTAICKQLQKVFDEVLFEDNGSGKNVYRVNNHDVAYLLACYTRRGKKLLAIAVAKNAYIHRIVMDVMHRVVTGKTYDLEYKMTSAKVSAPETKADAKPADKAKPAKAEAPEVAPAADPVVEEVVVEKAV